MSNLQEVSQLLIAAEPKKALEALRSWAEKYLPEKLGDINLQLSRVNLSARMFTKGMVTMADYQANLININNGVLVLLEECRQAAEATVASGPAGEPRQALQTYHAYTCDRVNQADSFRQYFGRAERERMHYFYLYGGDMQSHESFFRRLSYDLEGRLLDYLNPDLPRTCQALRIEVTFEFSRQLEIYKQNILRSLFSALGVPPNEHEPLLSRTLTYLLQHSPRLKGLTEHDYTCIYLHISPYDWDVELTPAVARWFIQDFSGGGLPATSPTFLFFFAIEYDDTEEQVSAEVRGTLSDSQHILPLPELNMVSRRDIGQWLEKYKQIAPSARERKEFLSTNFGDRDEHYMEDVEIELRKIIDQYNNQHVR